MKTNVRSYKNKELLDRVASLPSFTHLPKGHHIIAVRSNEDEPDRFDDKNYHFIGRTFKGVMSCTTNAGLKALRNPFRFNSKGVAVTKSDEIYYNTFMKTDGKFLRHHNGKIQCLRQIAPMKYYRDANGDSKTDEAGPIYEGNYSTNIHPNTYSRTNRTVRFLIGTWSYGCNVVNALAGYWAMLGRIPYNEPVTYTLLKEF